VAVTASGNLSAIVYAKVIEDLIIAYQYDQVTAPPYFRFRSIENTPSPTCGFPRYAKNSVGTVASETTSLTPTTFDLSSTTDLTVGRVGIAREISETALEDSIRGRALYTDEFVQDAAALYGEQLETDSTNLFSSVTASVGATGTALTIATLIAAIASQRVNKARGAQVIHLHDLQLKQLQQAQAASTALPWSQFFMPNGDATNPQYGGTLMNQPIWSSGKNPTANAGADRVGAIWAQGTNKRFCAFAFVLKRNPSSLELPDILQDAHIWASFMRYAFGIVANNFATKIVSVNA
jgi:hypothetical protein